MTAFDVEHLRGWIGRSEERHDDIRAWPVRALAATLDRDDPEPVAGDALPAPWHWLYFLDVKRQSELGRDGHPTLGGFLPPVALPRRMWAGGRMWYHGALRIGQSARRRSTIGDVTLKQGCSGPLAFVLVRHEIFGDDPDQPVIIEEHDTVYRAAADPGAPPPAPLPAPDRAVWSRVVTPDPVMLFRYSALTFNGHRIHYDLDFCRGPEAYPGLVVHGPLTATLMLDLCRRHQGRPITAFDYRAVRPVFGPAPYRIEGTPDANGTGARVWALDSDGALAMTGNVTFG